MFKSMFIVGPLAAVCLLTGCHSPSGTLFSATGGSQTWESTEVMQKTVTMVDVRTGDVFFAMDIPPGKQLTVDFEKDEGDDSVYTPDLMMYEVMDRGTGMGKLGNSMTVPNGACRRVEVTLRRISQYASAPADRPLRTDELADRPDWWTPEGGPMPADVKTELYDD